MKSDVPIIDLYFPFQKLVGDVLRVAKSCLDFGFTKVGDFLFSEKNIRA